MQSSKKLLPNYKIVSEEILRLWGKKVKSPKYRQIFRELKNPPETREKINSLMFQVRRYLRRVHGLHVITISENYYKTFRTTANGKISKRCYAQKKPQSLTEAKECIQGKSAGIYLPPITPKGQRSDFIYLATHGRDTNHYQKSGITLQDKLLTGLQNGSLNVKDTMQLTEEVSQANEGVATQQLAEKSVDFAQKVGDLQSDVLALQNRILAVGAEFIMGSPAPIKPTKKKTTRKRPSTKKKGSQK